MSYLKQCWQYRFAVLISVIAWVVIIAPGPRKPDGGYDEVPVILWFPVNLAVTYALATKLRRPLLTLSALAPILPALVALLPQANPKAPVSKAEATTTPVLAPAEVRSAPSMATRAKLPVSTEEAEIVAKLRAEVGEAGDAEMVHFLRALCNAYASNDRAQVERLEPLATIIGEELNGRGGIRAMRRVWELLGNIRGARTLDMHWNGIGDWRG